MATTRILHRMSCAAAGGGGLVVRAATWVPLVAAGGEVSGATEAGEAHSPAECD